MPVYAGPDRQPHPRSVDGFCHRNGICKAHFYNLLKRGEGPDIMKIGARTVISEESEASWKRRMTSKLQAA